MPTPALDRAVTALQRTGTVLLRYGLVLFILWFGAFKFTPAEAAAIMPLLGRSPFFGWVYALADAATVSRVVGTLEIAIALAIACRPLAPAASAVGSLAAAGIFLTTLSFLFTAPGLWARVDGFIVPAADGAFIVKDLMLLAAALWTAGEAARAALQVRSGRHA